MSTTTRRYTCHRLPIDQVEEWKSVLLAKKYTQLRIRGLRQSPQSFSATLEGELALTQEQQLERVKAKGKYIVVTVLHKESRPDKVWYEQEWVAQATLYGPRTWTEHTAPFRRAHGKKERRLSKEQIDRTSNALEKDKTAFWHMTALYVDEEHRKRGLAKDLCVYAFDLIKQTSSTLHAELRIIIKPTNLVVVKMYERLTFTSVSVSGGQIEAPYSTLTEATIAAGDSASLPSDYEEQTMYTTRFGLIMVKNIY